MDLIVTIALCIDGRMLPGVHCLSTGVQHRLSRMSASSVRGSGHLGCCPGSNLWLWEDGYSLSGYREPGDPIQTTVASPRQPASATCRRLWGPTVSVIKNWGSVTPAGIDWGPSVPFSHRQRLERVLRGQRQFPSVWAGTSAVKVGWGAQSLILGAMLPSPAQPLNPPQKARIVS